MQTDIRNLKEHKDKLQNKISEIKGQYDLLGVQLKELSSSIETETENQLLYKKAVEILDLAQKSVQASLKEKFESMVTYALHYVFGAEYKFELEFGRRGNLQEVDFNIKTKDLTEPQNPLDTSGGGVLDIVSLALRVAFLELYTPRIEGPIILDESFKHLSEQYLLDASEFLNVLSKKINRQIILVTHKNELINSAYNVIEIK